MPPVLERSYKWRVYNGIHMEDIVIFSREQYVPAVTRFNTSLSNRGDRAISIGEAILYSTMVSRTNRCIGVRFSVMVLRTVTPGQLNT
jgi:hypothetical protein